MLKEEEIIEILTKENFSKADLEKFLEAVRQNPELNDIAKISIAINKLAEKDHIDTGILANYILFLNGDKSVESEIILLKPKIEIHINKCEKCRRDFELLSSELNEIDNYLGEQIIPAKTAEKIPFVRKVVNGIFTNHQFKYSFAAAASVVILFLSLFGISELTTPAYIKMTPPITLEDFSSTRSRTSSHFTNALFALENKNYDSAFDELQKDIELNQKDLTIFYSYYLLGMAHLSNAHSDFLGLFDSYDTDELSSAIYNFNKVLELNDSGLFHNVNINTYYFLGKSYLLNKDFDKAEKNLEIAVKNKSEYTEEAVKLLSAIKKNKLL